MSFEERNAGWAGEPRTFIQFHSRGSAPRVWGIRVMGDQIHTTWGQLNGAMQHAVEQMQGVNIGKKNEKSPAQYALERSREMCRKKNWEGYREVGADNQPLDPVVQTDINFEDLPLSLCFYKPQNSLIKDCPGLTKKAEAGQAWYARKANGMMYALVRGSGPTKLYSRRMLRQHDDEQKTQYTWDNRFAHLVSSADRFMAPNSILLGELVMQREDGTEDFEHVQSVTKSLTPQALADQEARGWVQFYVWDIAFWDGKDLVRDVPVRERYELIHEVVDAPFFIPVQFYTGDFCKTPRHAGEFAKRGWKAF